MDVELIAVGNELLLGATVNTNAADLSRALATVGARVSRVTTVGDAKAAIGGALTEARHRVALVVVTGGLGPTPDDRTKQAVAEQLGRALYTDQAYLAALEARWVARGRPAPMPRANHTQAEVIEGADVLLNPRGTAPGLWIEDRAGVIVLLPGVPAEMRGLLAEAVLPRLAARNVASDRRAHARVIRTTGLAESAMADLSVPGGVELAWLPHEGGVDLRVLAWGGAEAKAAVERATADLRTALGDAVYGSDADDLAAVVLDLLAADGHTLAVAESCTGGMVGARLTAVPGSSRVFLGGVIAYADAVKHDLLGVPPEVLDRHGAVSELVTRAMAEGVVRRFGASAAVAVSGIAGPDGGTPDKPVGTVWLAVRVGKTIATQRLLLPGDRAAIRERAVFAALDMLRRMAGG